MAVSKDSARKRKVVNYLPLVVCFLYLAFLFLQFYDGFLVTLLPTENPEQAQSTEGTVGNQRKSRASQSPTLASIPTDPQQAGASATTSSTVRRNPLIVYRGDNGRIRACVIPRVCSAEPVIPGITKEGSPKFYFPQEYRRYQKVLSDCLKVYPNFQFYDGEKPSTGAAWYNVDVLGRSCTPRWHAHFAHFIFHFSKQVLAAASLFRSEGKSTLPSPECVYPSNNGSISSSCRRVDIESLKPRVLVSHLVFKTAWNRNFLQFVQRGTAPQSKTRQPLLYQTSWSSRTKNMGEQRLECYRSLITTPENFDIDRPGHDSILRAAGIKRTPECDKKPHVVLLSRRYGLNDLSRKVLNSTLNGLRSELSKSSKMTVEWIYGLGQLNFTEQVQLMQKADVLVTAHGAELSNALFLRRDARIIELMPFGGDTNYFKYSVADPIHAKHIAYGTIPDPGRFYKCVEKYLRSGETKSALDKARAMYRKHNTLYGQAKNEMQRQKAGLFHVGHGVRQKCIKSQVAGFNPRALARIISREASTRCDGRK